MKTIYNLKFLKWSALFKGTFLFVAVLISHALKAQVNFNADKTSICVGETVTFTNVSAGNYFNWDFSGYNFIGVDTSYTFNNQGNYPVTLNAYDTTGGNFNSLGSQTIWIYVNERPDEIRSSTNEACPGEYIDFNLNSQIQVFSYDWDFGNGYTSTQSYVNYSYSSEGNYTVRLIVNSDCGVDTIYKSIKVGNDAIPNAMAYTNPQSACPGDEIQFNPQNWNNEDYSWDFGDGSSSTDRDPRHAYSSIGEWVYTLTVINKCGNSGSYTDTVTISDNLTFSGNNNWVGVNATKEEACPGDMIDFSAYGAAASTYFWNFDDGTTSTEATPSHAFADTGTYNVSVLLTNGCGADTLLSRNIYINSNQPAGYSYMEVRPSSACPGAPIEFHSSEGFDAYLWEFGDGTTSDMRNTTHIYDSIGEYTVTLKVYNGCGNFTSQTKVVTIDGNVVPQIQYDQNFGAGSTTACPNDSMAFYAFGGSSYIWDFGDGTSTSETSVLQVGDMYVDIANHAYADTGTYTVKLTYFNACGNSAMDSFLVSIGYNEQVEGGMPELGDEFYACQEIPLLGLGGGTYEWDFGDGDSLTTTEGQISHVFSSAGSYTVSVKITNSCGSSETFSRVYTIMEMSASAAKSHPKCYGAKTGFINLTVDGGIAPYSYSWSNGAISQDLDSLAAGSYTVVITDKNGCSISETYTINAPDALVLNGSSTSSTCGDAVGMASVSATGGTGSYTYSWSPVAGTTASINNLGSGVYTVLVTDSNSCSKSLAVSVSDAGAPTIDIGTVIDVTCYGGNNGAINTTISGGTAPYDIDWSNNAITGDISALTAGNYGLTVTDANGCIASVSTDIVQPTEMSVVSAITDASCYGDSAGSIKLTVSGGTAPYSYAWSNSNATQNNLNIIAGNYSVTIMDENGCSMDKNYSVGQPASAVSVSGVVTNVGCNNGNTGSISLTVSGGTSPYTYSWSNGAISKNLSSKPAGNYSVTVTDSKGCSSLSSFEITQPTALALTYNVTEVLCNGSMNGAIDVTVSGGVMPYVYNWVSGQSTQDLGSIGAGEYSLTVTDNNGCAKNTVVDVNEPDQLMVTDFLETNLLCYGEANGSIDITVAGGTAPYEYVWSNEANTQDITGLVAGLYDLEIFDANGCSEIFWGLITQPDSIGLVINTSNSTCGNSDGTASVVAVGGTGVYTYDWQPGGSNADNVSGIGAGNYTVTVTDDNGCVAEGIASVNDDGAPVIIVDSVAGVDCNGQATGAVYVSVSGGAQPYSHSWTNATTDEDLINVGNGVYGITVTDDNGCKASKNATVTQNPVISISGVVTNVTCFGDATGAINVSVTGGVAAYTYDWSNSATTQDVTGIASGNYDVTVTDSKGCQKSKSFTVNELSTPVVITADVVEDVNCKSGNDGLISISASGGTAPYTYLWSNNETVDDLSNLSAGEYSVIATDSKGCMGMDTLDVAEPAAALAISASSADLNCYNDNSGSIDITVSGGTQSYSYAWLSGETTQDLLGLAAGTYSLTVTDANSCMDSVEVTITEPAELTASSVATDVTCNGGNDGSISISANGGTIAYTYSLNSGTGQSSATFIGLSANDYYVVVTDANGCEVTVNDTVSEPALLTASISANGAVLTTDAAVAYQWMLDSQNITGANAQSYTALVTGVYSVTITDLNGCSATSDTVSVVISSLAASANGNEINVYPNPVSDNLNVTFKGIKAETLNIKLVNSLGQELLVITKKGVTGVYTESIDMKKYPEGYYNLMIQADDELKVIKFLKIK